MGETGLGKPAGLKDEAMKTGYWNNVRTWLADCNAPSRFAVEQGVWMEPVVGSMGPPPDVTVMRWDDMRQATCRKLTGVEIQRRKWIERQAEIAVGSGGKCDWHLMTTDERKTVIAEMKRLKQERQAARDYFLRRAAQTAPTNLETDPEPPPAVHPSTLIPHPCPRE